MTHRHVLPAAAFSVLLSTAAVTAAQVLGDGNRTASASQLCGEPKAGGKDETPNPSALCGEPKEGTKDKTPAPSLID